MSFSIPWSVGTNIPPTLSSMDCSVSSSMLNYPISDMSIGLANTSNLTANALHARGDVIVDGDLKVNGTISAPTIESRLDAIESRLAILRPNSDLESRWDELKAARERYQELEAEFRRYEQVLDILKN